MQRCTTIVLYTHQPSHISPVPTLAPVKVTASLVGLSNTAGTLLSTINLGTTHIRLLLTLTPLALLSPSPSPSLSRTPNDPRPRTLSKVMALLQAHLVHTGCNRSGATLLSPSLRVSRRKCNRRYNLKYSRNLNLNCNLNLSRNLSRSHRHKCSLKSSNPHSRAVRRMYSIQTQPTPTPMPMHGHSTTRGVALIQQARSTSSPSLALRKARPPMQYAPPHRIACRPAPSNRSSSSSRHSSRIPALCTSSRVHPLRHHLTNTQLIQPLPRTNQILT